MNTDIIDLYKMTDQRESKLWVDAIYIFDTSALLDFYYFPTKTRKKIYEEIFEKLKNRLWIPGHVKYEYLKNRENVIKKPISLNYEPLEKDVCDTKNKVDNVIKHINSIVNYTKKDDKHPHIEQSELTKFQLEIEKVLEVSKEFEKKVFEQIQVAKKDVLSVAENDDILNSIDKYFDIGRDFSFKEIIDITKEGCHRYKYKIPPGYGDYYNEEKKGTQIFGDLIIWNQILEYAQEKKLPIIFLTNDNIKDEDWCYIDKNKNVIGPREELIKELYDTSKSEFWIYSLTQFLHKANTYLKSTIEEETIKNISNLLNEQHRNIEISLFSLLDEVNNILVNYNNKKEFTRIYNVEDEERLYSLSTKYKNEVEEYSKEEKYAKYFEKQNSLLIEINSLNYHIHYQEIRMKVDTIKEEKRLKIAINNFCNIYSKQKEENESDYIEYLIDIYENMDLGDY
ncbi:PIN domain-containing protein [Aliarcobacter butzleri]|uniref:PIN domain-containing protein n=1 Tax=Aliarcobacter butzleri TaxID=28197 RepID=UPI003AF61FAD